MSCCDIYMRLNDRIMPAIGLGTWMATDEEYEKVLEKALEIGYRHIDTAQFYENEHIIGKVLDKWFEAGLLDRDDIFITTKLKVTDAYPEKVEKALEDSLKKLHLEYVDLFLMHFPVSVYVRGNDSFGDTNVSYLDVWKKMEELYDSGKTKQIGVSNFNKRQIENLLLNSRVKPINNQIELHVYLQQPLLVDYCQKNDVTVVAYSPLGAPAYNIYLEKNGHTPKKVLNPLMDKVVMNIAKKHSKTTAQILLRFLIQSGVGVIPKTVHEDRLRENFNIFDFGLEKEDMDKLRALDVGEDARVVDWKFFNKITEHPEYPFVDK